MEGESPCSRSRIAKFGLLKTASATSEYVLQMRSEPLETNAHGTQVSGEPAGVVRIQGVVLHSRFHEAHRIEVAARLVR